MLREQPDRMCHGHRVSRVFTVTKLVTVERIKVRGECLTDIHPLTYMLCLYFFVCLYLYREGEGRRKSQGMKGFTQASRQAVCIRAYMSYM